MRALSRAVKARADRASAATSAPLSPTSFRRTVVARLVTCQTIFRTGQSVNASRTEIDALFAVSCATFTSRAASGPVRFASDGQPRSRTTAWSKSGVEPISPSLHERRPRQRTAMARRGTRRRARAWRRNQNIQARCFLLGELLLVQHNKLLNWQARPFSSLD